MWNSLTNHFWSCLYWDAVTERLQTTLQCACRGPGQVGVDVVQALARWHSCYCDKRNSCSKTTGRSVVHFLDWTLQLLMHSLSIHVVVLLFTRDSVYAVARTTYMLSPVRLSVTRVDESKTVEVRIMQFSPYSGPIPLVFCGISFIVKFWRDPPERGRQTRVGGETSYFLALCVNISKTAGDACKVTINDW